MNWFQKHYGTGLMPILAVIFIIAFSIGLWIGISWVTGLSVLSIFIFIFWTQRNTK